MAVWSGPPLESFATLAAHVFNAASTAEPPSVVVDAAHAAAEKPVMHASTKHGHIFFLANRIS